MRPTSLVASLALSTSLLACGGSSSQQVDAAGDDPDAFPGEHFTVSWGEVEVQPGEEDTRCVTLQLDNDEPLKIRAIHNELGAQSHHLIVYRDDSGAALNPVPTPCQPFAGTLNPDGMAAPLMVTQRSSETLTLPDGIAFSFSARQTIRLEMHYINTTEAPMMATATTEFISGDPATVTAEADFLFTGTPDIDLAAGAQQTVSAYFRMPASLDGINIFAITGHTHHLGTDMQVATRASADGADTPVYAPTAFSWSEPETITHDPPFQVPTGGGFAFECDYHNTTNGQVGFGESANDEMCFFWAYYYPSQGSKVCFHTDQVGNGVDLCCPDAGPQLCGALAGGL
ncbi:MAG: hypothetical protein R2939_05670 [Kofleriaceae bacterium]